MTATTRQDTGYPENEGPQEELEAANLANWREHEARHQEYRERFAHLGMIGIRGRTPPPDHQDIPGARFHDSTEMKMAVGVCHNAWCKRDIRQVCVCSCHVPILGQRLEVREVSPEHVCLYPSGARVDDGGGFERCIEGTVYGPCYSDDCGGVCESKGTCPCWCHPWMAGQVKF